MRTAIACRAFVAVTFTAAVALAPLAAAQDKPASSLSAAATATVKNVASRALSSAQDLTSSALDLIGIRYRFGGNTPESGLDCSGLVRYVFQQVTGVVLPRTAKDMSRVGEKVATHDLQPGDLVFFNTRRYAFSHVGIYVGDNRFIHAPRRGRDVEVATLDSSFWRARFDGARRMIGVLPKLLPSLVGEAAAAPLLPSLVGETAALPLLPSLVGEAAAAPLPPAVGGVADAAPLPPTMAAPMPAADPAPLAGLPAPVPDDWVP